MRKFLLKTALRIRIRFYRFYTWLWRSSLKSCGEGVRFEYPLRLDQPDRISIGANCVLYPRTWMNPVSEWAGVKHRGEIVIGDRVMIGYGVQISAAESVVIENEVAIGAGAVIVDHIHDHSHIDSPIFFAPISKPRPVRIGKGSFLGVYCLVGPGVQIGEHAVVAANAVVMKDVPAYCMAVGNPARIMRPQEMEGSRAAATDGSGGAGG